MTIKKRYVLIISMLLIVESVFLLVFFNILQNGNCKWDGRSIDEILGKPARMVNLDDLENLNKSEIMQIFFAAGTPDIKSLNGTYRGKVLNAGIMSLPIDFLYSRVLGPGEWEGEEFTPGVNENGKVVKMFLVKDENGDKQIVKSEINGSYIASSAIDKKKSLHLDFTINNWGVLNTEHDEIRKINNGLLICMVYMPISGGIINPIPVALYAETKR